MPCYESSPMRLAYKLSSLLLLLFSLLLFFKKNYKACIMIVLF